MRRAGRGSLWQSGRVKQQLVRILMVAFVAAVVFCVVGPSPGPQFDSVASGLREVKAEAQSAMPFRLGAGVPGRSMIGAAGRLDVGELANIMMFVPFGVLFPARWPRRRRWTIPAAVVLALAIEITQLVFLPWRTPSMADIGWNTVGAVLGFALWIIVIGPFSQRLGAGLSDAGQGARRPGH
ncbi:MAG: VanZ family protein [Acidimicrobiia bacterium]|nr:VanZ family protein [Acidimicrobiia bacterium]